MLARTRSFALLLVPASIVGGGCLDGVVVGTETDAGTGGGDAECAAGGCPGPAALGAAPFLSGPRLKAVTLRGPSGAEVLDGWHDAQLGLDCEFHRAEDGVQRCLPTFAGAFYADAECTEAFITGGGVEIAPGPAYGEMYIPTGPCDGESYGYVFQRTGTELVPLARTYLKDGSGCYPNPVDDAFDYTGYAAVYVPPSTFVAGVPQYEALGDDLGRLVSVHEDGSLHALTAAGPDGTPCERVGEEACVPSLRVRVRNGFTDEGCTTAQGQVGVSVCGARHATTLSPTCEAPQIFELGAAAHGVTHSDVDEAGVSVCSPLDPLAQVATPRSLTDFPALASTVKSGAAPGLVTRYDARGDVPTSSLGRLETAEGEPCEAHYHDGIYTCVPSPLALSVTEYWSDPDCTERLVPEESYACDGAPRSIGFLGEQGRDFYAVDAESYTGLVYQKGTTCSVVEEPLPPVHRVGARRDLASLPTLTRQTYD